MPKKDISDSSSGSSDNDSSSPSRSPTPKKKHSTREKESRKSRKSYKHRDDKKKKRKRSSSRSSPDSSASRSRDKSRDRKHKRKSRSKSPRDSKKKNKDPSPKKQAPVLDEEKQKEEEKRKKLIRLAKVKALVFEKDNEALAPKPKVAASPIKEEEVKESPKLRPANRIGLQDELEESVDEDEKSVKNGGFSLNAMQEEDEEIDPLDAYMNEINKVAAKQVIESFNKDVPKVEEEEYIEENLESKVITAEDLMKIRKKFDSSLFLDKVPVIKKDFLEDDVFGDMAPELKIEKEKEEEIIEDENEEEYRKAFLEALKKNEEQAAFVEPEKKEDKKKSKRMTEEELEEEIMPFVDEDLGEGEFISRKKKETERKELKQVDHAVEEYQFFRKNFYIEAKEITEMTSQEVEQYRRELGEIQVRGKDCPKPIKNWYQCGLSDSVLNILVEKRKYKNPFPIQCQALPAVMAGRDVIGIAETGSGKTLAYLLPLLRHIKDQRPLEDGDGPIALIMAPTRELAFQIANECRSFGKHVGIRVASVYGGADMAQQIAELKRGAEIIVCTPGRMIEVLATSNGKITNLKRVTFIVLDEADRMFDLGFEPQIAKIIHNVRPDKQTVMFSATFPRNVENLAKKILHKPIEIIVGSRGKICSNINQIIEIREEDTKFLRLLEVLGEWNDKGSILIFVDKQTEADNLFKELLKYGYFSLVLHGGQDPQDREFTIIDFKKGVRTIMVATSVCARGLDISSIVLVINYRCPNHKEDYIHRIGRTGRAGNKGTAITFITTEEEQYSLDLIAALKMSHSDIPEDLQNMADNYKKRVEKGEAKFFKSKNLRGTGFKFDDGEFSKMREARVAMKKRFGIDLQIDEADLSDDEIISKKSENDGDKQFDDKLIVKMIKDPQTKAIVMAAATQAAKDALSAGASSEEVLTAAHTAIKNILVSRQGREIDQVVRIRDQIETREEENSDFVSADLEINDYPPAARNKGISKDFISMMQELTSCTISVRGSHIESNKKPLPGQKKLTLHIIGETKYLVGNCYREIVKMLDDLSLQAMGDSAAGFGKS